MPLNCTSTNSSCRSLERKETPRVTSITPVMREWSILDWGGDMNENRVMIIVMSLRVRRVVSDDSKLNQREILSISTIVLNQSRKLNDSVTNKTFC